MKISYVTLPRTFWLVSGLLVVTLALLGWHVLSVVQPTVAPLPWKQYLPSFLQAAFYIASFFTIRTLLGTISFYNTEERLATTAGSGLLVLGIALVPALMQQYWPATDPNSNVILLLEGMLFIMLTLYFSLGTLLFIPLTTQRSRPWLKKIHPLLVITIITAAISQGLFQSAAANIVFFLAAGIFALLITYHTGWITELSRKSRISAFTYLLATFFIGGALLLNIYFQPSAGFLPLAPEQSLFLLLTGGFMTLFSGWSALTLFFHLPIARVLDAREEEQEHLVEMSQLAEERKDITSIMHNLAKSAMDHCQADACWISEARDGTPENELVTREGISDNDRKRVEYTLHAHPAHFQLDGVRHFIYIRNLRADPHLKDHTLDFQSLAVFPFQSTGDREWHLHLASREPQGFEEQQLRQLKSYITHARLSINNVSMLQSNIEKERLENDIAIGQQVQQRLLPAHFPASQRVDIMGASLAAEEIGGDYYDCHQMEDGRLAILMADVSGKGTSAAFHVAEMKGIFQSLMLSDPDPKTFLTQSNRAIAHCFEKGMFITLIYAVLDLDGQQMEYARGGHCPLLHFNAHDNKIQLMKDDGLGLGIVRDESYEQTIKARKLDLHTHDLLVFYTDGIVEARNPATGEEYGYDRLRDCVYLNLELPARHLTNKILQDVEQFTQGEASKDDQSVLVVRVR